MLSNQKVQTLLPGAVHGHRQYGMGTHSPQPCSQTRCCVLRKQHSLPFSPPSLPITHAVNSVDTSIPPHSSFFQFVGLFLFFFPALLPAWKIDFCPLHCHRKHQHRSADKDLLNKDSSFHWTEGEQLRHQVMFLSLLSFGEASLTEENAILSEFVLGVLCQSPGRISSSLILHTYVFCKERFQPSISLSS